MLKKSYVEIFAIYPNVMANSVENIYSLWNQVMRSLKPFKKVSVNLNLKLLSP